MFPMNLFDFLFENLQRCFAIPYINNRHNILLVFHRILRLNFFHIKLLLNANSILDVPEIVIFHVSFQNIYDVVELFALDVFQPFLFSNCVGFYSFGDFILEQGLFVKRAIEGADDVSLWETEDIFGVSANFKANVNCSVHNKEHFINILDRQINDCFFLFLSRLKQP